MHKQKNLLQQTKFSGNQDRAYAKLFGFKENKKKDNII